MDFFKIYQVQETDEDAKNVLPEVKVGEEINILKLNDEQHFSRSTSHDYSEASLVKKTGRIRYRQTLPLMLALSQYVSTRNYVELS